MTDWTDHRTAWTALIESYYGIARPLCPGPLRERILRQFPHADLIFFVGDGRGDLVTSTKDWLFVCVGPDDKAVAIRLSEIAEMEADEAKEQGG